LTGIPRSEAKSLMRDHNSLGKYTVAKKYVEG